MDPIAPLGDGDVMPNSHGDCATWATFARSVFPSTLNMMQTPPSHSPTTSSEPSPLERIKAQSNYLRGRIAEELAGPGDHFSDETAQLLKHHGMYQQDDRDRRQRLGDHGTKPPRAYSLMVRTVVPGGWLTSEQLLAHLDLCDELAAGTVRITSRQDLQIHGIPKQNICQVIRRINEMGLTTAAACGDVRRNVMCCPAPYWRDPVHSQMRWLASRLTEELRPRMPVYREIWLGEPGATPSGNGADPEPLYGKTYLPRKFKVGIGLPGDNCIDVHSQDVGLLAICENFNVIGYNVLVGGGMGMTPGRKDTFPALAQPMAYVEPDESIDVVKAILRVLRDFGNRADRRRARLKYLVADWGLEKFKAQTEAYLGRELAEPRQEAVWDVDDHAGWKEQGDGRWFYGLYVENGRILDRNDLRLKSALREVCRKYHLPLTLTPNQGMLLCDVQWEDRPGLEDLLRRHGVKGELEISSARRWAEACVALPTCPLAITESERALPGVIDQLEVELARLGLAQELMNIRMTGCANGCSRPYNADIGLVGRTAGRYAVYLGGRRLGDRLGFLYLDGVPREQIVATLVPLLADFKQHRRPGESFGDYCFRKKPNVVS
jgi:sulfite reductase (ferredoxin)